MWRRWVIFGLFAAIYLLIVSRLFYWQVIRGTTLRQQASAQYDITLPLPAVRGQILASDGSALVLNKPASLVYAKPKEIKDIPRFAAEVSGILSLDKNVIIERLSYPNIVWSPLAHKIDDEIVQKLKDTALAGLGYEREPKRYYPEASMAAHLLGFVGLDQNSTDRGYFGLEGFYDRELRGKDGVLKLQKDVRGAPILIGDATRIEPQNGRVLTLSVDRTVQYALERRLAEGIQKYGAKQGSVVVMDPKTGGVLGMASFPSYDPRAYTAFDKELYKNPIVADGFEPGSTFKALIMSAALSEKLVTPTTMMDETGPVQIGEYAVRTWNNQYHGKISMTQVLEYSSNVGMVFIEKKLGKDRLLNYIRSFGFGEPTGVDLEEELSPDLRRDADWAEIDLATASFGQGIAVTPLQMVRAVGVLANGGTLMEPHVVFEIRDSKGKITVIKPKKIRQVISPAAAKIVTEMMIAAVDNGEAKWAKPKGYRIAGKTGTAQIPVAGHYDEKKTIASFVGFAPADDPKFVMLVTLREPSSSQWGSETAAPLFFNIARDIFAYYGIAPSE